MQSAEIKAFPFIDDFNRLVTRKEKEINKVNDLETFLNTQMRNMLQHIEAKAISTEERYWCKRIIEFIQFSLVVIHDLEQNGNILPMLEKCSSKQCWQTIDNHWRTSLQNLNFVIQNNFGQNDAAKLQADFNPIFSEVNPDQKLEVGQIIRIAHKLNIRDVFSYLGRLELATSYNKSLEELDNNFDDLPKELDGFQPLNLIHVINDVKLNTNYLNNIEREINERGLVSIVLQINLDHWVHLSIVKDKDRCGKEQIYAYYKNPMGYCISNSVIKNLRTTYPDIRVISDLKEDQLIAGPCGGFATVYTCAIARMNRTVLFNRLDKLYQELCIPYLPQDAEKIEYAIKGKEQDEQLSIFDYLTKGINEGNLRNKYDCEIFKRESLGKLIKLEEVLIKPQKPLSANAPPTTQAIRQQTDDQELISNIISEEFDIVIINSLSNEHQKTLLKKCKRDIFMEHIRNEIPDKSVKDLKKFREHVNDVFNNPDVKRNLQNPSFYYEERFDTWLKKLIVTIFDVLTFGIFHKNVMDVSLFAPTRSSIRRDILVM